MLEASLPYIYLKLILSSPHSRGVLLLQTCQASHEVFTRETMLL